MRHRPGRAAGPGGRAGSGQRRSGSTGRLLHRLAGHHERALRRLRHPLRVRHLPADLRRRPPGRAGRLLARPRGAVGVPAPRGRADRHLRRSHREVHRHRRGRAVPLGAGLEGQGRPVQLHGPRLPERPGEHAAAVARGRHRRVRPADLQLRRLRGGRPRADLRGEHLQGALPRGLHAAGQGAAAAAAVLLRLRLHPRLPQLRAAQELRPEQPAAADHLPAQRHPPGDRRTRADAGADRREEDGVGRGLGDHPAVLRLHLPHPAAGGPGGLVGRPARSAAAAAPGDHLPDQRGVPGEGLRALRRRPAPDQPDVDHRRAPGAGGPDGVPRHRRRRQGERRGRAALPAAAGQGAARLRRVLPGQVHQRDQRRHPAPVRPAGQPGAVGADHRRPRGGLADRPRAAARARAVRRGRGVPRAVPRGQGAQQAPAQPGAGASGTAQESTTPTCST